MTILQLEHQAAGLVKRAGTPQVPDVSRFLTQAYKESYEAWTDAPGDAGVLEGLLKFYKKEASGHFERRKLLSKDPLNQASLVNRSDAFVRYWVNSFANRGILTAGLLDPQYTRKVWVSMNDFRTSDICYHLNGEIRGLEENFSFANFTGLIPPGHFRCRSLIRLLP